MKIPTCVLLFAGALSAAGAAPLMKDFIGINGHTVQFRPALYRPVAGLVRDYHPVAWDLGDDPSQLPRLPSAKNGVNWEAVYGSWAAGGWTTDASLMFESVARPHWQGLPEAARNYGRALAAALGPSAKKPLLSSVEIGNEPGKWSDADYAAMLRAMAAGIREGDPALRIATCNVVAGPSDDYSKSVSCLDGLDGSYDILSTHTYAMAEGWPTWRRSFPEDPKLPDYLKRVEDLCTWRDAHARGKPVWVTEFGYDSSTKKPPAKGDFARWQGVTDTQQAQWLVRSLLVFSAMPVDRAYVYFFNDDDQPSLHASSGITRHFQPKPSFHALAHLQKTLGDFRFRRIVENRPGALRIQEYRADSGALAWAVWSPTGSGRSATLALPPFPARLARAESMPLDASGAKSVRVPPDRRVTVTESPLYLVFSPPPN